MAERIGESVADVLKDFQTRKVYRMNISPASSRPMSFSHIPTGIFELDLATLGGFPRGAVTCLFGRRHAGKSTNIHRAIASAQRRFPKHRTVLVDLENTFEPFWAAAHGVDLDRLDIAIPDSGEHAVDLIENLLATDDLILLAVDSIATMESEQILERSADKPGMAMRPRLVSLLVSKTLMRLRAATRDNPGPAVIFANQIRSSMDMYGPKFSLPGGNSLEHLLSLSIELSSKEIMGPTSSTEKLDKAYQIQVPVESECSFRLVKNKIGQSTREGSYSLWRDPTHPTIPVGYIDDTRSVFNRAVSYGLGGAASKDYWIDGCPKRHTNDRALLQWLADNPDKAEAIKQKIISTHRKAMGLSPEGWLADGRP